jgi:exodeoxyribonuclease III
VKIITWNVNGIRARHAQLDALLAEECPDIVCLQEIKAAPDQVPELLVAATDHWTFWHGAGGYSGVAVLVRHSFFTERPAFTHPSFDVEHRVVVADLGAIQVASVYVPNGGKDYEAKLRFLDGFAAWATETIGTGRTLLICGDLNVAREERDVHPKERKPNQVGTRPEERERFSRLLDVGLVDVGRALDPDNDELFTWWAPWRNLRQRNIGWRIDYVLASTGQAGRAISSVSRRDYGTSDHAPLVVVFA